MSSAGTSPCWSALQNWRRWGRCRTLLACLYWLVRLDASQIEQRYGSPILLPSRPELLVLLAVGRAAAAAPTGRPPRRGALALHGEIKEESAGQPERGRPTILGPSILVPWRPAERHLPCSFVPACAFRRRSTAGFPWNRGDFVVRILLWPAVSLAL
jgi:hypothetical protein